MSALDRLEDVRHLRTAYDYLAQRLGLTESAHDTLLWDRIETHLASAALDGDETRLRMWAVEQAVAMTACSPLSMQRCADAAYAYVKGESQGESQGER